MSNNITGAMIGNGGIAPGPLTTKAILGSVQSASIGEGARYPSTRETKVSCFEVQEADNGYILRYWYREGDYARYKIAKDMEEVRDLVTSILVERKLGI